MENYKLDHTSELPHQQRVVVEANELGVKIEALNTFIGSNPIFLKLDGHEQSRLKNQVYFMIKYFDVLKERVENF